MHLRIAQRGHRADLPIPAKQKTVKYRKPLCAYKLTREPWQVISGTQIRAARGLLGMSSRQVASISGVSWATIKRFEDADGVPPSRSGTLERLVHAFEKAGVEFLGDPTHSPGVRLKR